ncbi:MAG TPA: hypothetical protein VNJ47_02240 [Nevskiales bacterium]|nr:hypothetical protein [Nevskiales bacterium]
MEIRAFILGAGLGIACLPALMPAQAEEAVVNPVAKVRNLVLSIKGTPDNVASLCRLALVQTLEEEEFTVVKDRAKADAELVFTGNPVTITQGRRMDIGKVQLSYAVEVNGSAGRIWSLVDHEWGSSLADACEDAAGDIADELAEARDDD